MDKKTYDALITIMTWARKRGADETHYEEFMQVNDWLDEVEKDYVGADATEV